MDGQEKRDLRVQKTYMALFQSFQDLLTQKSFEKLTVREICDRAMVRTATFYKHFTDKYDFAAFMIRELRTEFEDHNRQQEISGGVDYYLQIVKDGLLLLQKHESLIQSLDSDTLMLLIAESERENVRKELIIHLKEEQKRGHNLAAEPELLADILIGSMQQINRWWIAHKDSCSIDDMTEKARPFVERLLG